MYCMCEKNFTKKFKVINRYIRAKQHSNKKKTFYTINKSKLSSITSIFNFNYFKHQASKQVIEFIDTWKSKAPSQGT